MTNSEKVAAIEEIINAPDLVEAEKYDRILDVIQEGKKPTYK